MPSVVQSWVLIRSLSPARHFAQAGQIAKCLGTPHRHRRNLLAFIRAGQTEDTYAIAQMLLADKHDLIHKAVGWALREAGKQKPDQLIAFLEEHYARLPHCPSLRYRALFTCSERFLAGDFTRIVSNGEHTYKRHVTFAPQNGCT